MLSQILTVFKDRFNKTPFHIELDSGASITFCEEKAALQHGFKIKYNKQISKLGDGETFIKSIREIMNYFTEMIGAYSTTYRSHITAV